MQQTDGPGGTCTAERAHIHPYVAVYVYPVALWCRYGGSDPCDRGPYDAASGGAVAVALPSPDRMAALSLIDPLTYAVDGMRQTVMAFHHGPLAARIACALTHDAPVTDCT